MTKNIGKIFCFRAAPRPSGHGSRAGSRESEAEVPASPLAGRASGSESKRVFRSNKGFTLVEFMITMGILGIIAVASFGALAGLRSEAELEDARTVLRTALEYARSRAVSGVGTTPHGVHIEPGRIVLFEGAAYAGSGRESVLPPRVTTSETATDVVFARVSGAYGGTITVTLTHASGATKVVSVDPDGTIQSP